MRSFAQPGKIETRDLAIESTRIARREEDETARGDETVRSLAIRSLAPASLTIAIYAHPFASLALPLAVRYRPVR